MSLKEFDAKQFLLEKGEQIGLGIALTLMVLMLIFSLFMPSKGFFSGSPAAKAEVLKQGADKLERDLREKEPNPSELPPPEKAEGRLINLDKNFLLARNYEVLSLFEPTVRESGARRPPTIYNVEEGYVADARVLIDTYLLDRDFKKIWILKDKDEGKKQASVAGGPNPFLRAFGNGGGGMPAMPAMPQGQGSMAARYYQQSQSRLRGALNPAQLFKGPGSSDTEYEPEQIPIGNWNPQQLTARQPIPLRLAVIGGSFPFRRQLDEFRKKLHLPDIRAVLNEEWHDKSGMAFEFRGVDIQRMEVDADGNKLSEWSTLPIAETYKMWLMRTFRPFQPEDSKYGLVKWDGLTAPLLREFHADKKVDPTMMTPGMMAPPGIPGQPGAPQPPGRRGAEPEGGDVKSKYPDIINRLPKIQDTLAKLNDAKATRIAAPKTKAGDYNYFDPFRPNAAPPADNTQAGSPKPSGSEAAQDYIIPDYVLVRAVDVDLEPGKYYRYRLRIKMNNPNYKHPDVASPEYKRKEILESKDWFEIPQTVSVPPELAYYVVDEKQLASSKEQNEIIKKRISAQARQWAAQGPSPDQVVFQFHRWIETTQLSRKESDAVPVGEWAVADRVFVSRGEYVGRKVRVDLPIWKYTQNAYVLPAEEQKGVPLRKQTTGIDVDFGFDGSPKEDTILVDFEGGRGVQSPSKPKIKDDCAIEVLMLSPDGKLLARNSVKDTEDKERQERRKEVLERIENIREGKTAE
jgi:hypothetical protein